VSLLTFLTLTKIARRFSHTERTRLNYLCEKVRSDIESLANVSKDTPVSSISHDLSLRYMNDMDTITSSTGYANAMTDLMVMMENAVNGIH